VQLLAERPELVDVIDGSGKTALFYAAKLGDSIIVGHLLASRPKVIDASCLWYSLGVESEAVMELLLASKPELALSVDSVENTLLHRVLGHRSRKDFYSPELIMRVYHLNPAALRERNGNRETPFHIARSSKNEFAMGFLQWKLSIFEIFEGLPTFDFYTFEDPHVSRRNRSPLVIKSVKDYWTR